MVYAVSLAFTGCNKQTGGKLQSMETIRTLAMRKAIRNYRSEQISEDELNRVLCAGSLSPVGLAAFENYRLTVVQDKGLLKRITEATAKAFDYNPMMSNTIYGAPTLIVISAIPNPNPEMPGIEIASAACIADTMLIAATDIGLASIYLCAFVEGFKAEPELIKELGLPDSFSPAAGILLGYTDEPSEEQELAITLKVNKIL
jgi:nitroreductase